MKKSKEVKITREQVEKKKKRIIKTFITLVAIIIVGIIGYKANDYIILDKNKSINLIINNKNATLNLKKDILIQDEEIYIAIQDLKNFFDKYIYEDKENNQIITTYEDRKSVV